MTESLPNGIERIWAFDNDTPANSAYHQGFAGTARGLRSSTPAWISTIPTWSGHRPQIGQELRQPRAPARGRVRARDARLRNSVGAAERGRRGGRRAGGRLVPVKIFDDAGNSSEALVAVGFNHVLALNADGNPANDVDVVSMSFGESGRWGDA